MKYRRQQFKSRDRCEKFVIAGRGEKVIGIKRIQCLPGVKGKHFDSKVRLQSGNIDYFINIPDQKSATFRLMNIGDLTATRKKEKYY